MPDYYSILGLSRNASLFEIKTAFRRLAKLYHPDKNPNNPNAKQMFESVLTAYEVLSNSITKRRYDNSLLNASQNNSSIGNRTQQRTKKNWDVSAEDLKQRQFYQNYYKAKTKKSSTKKSQQNYSDYKYVLFATPLAVGLLLLIVSILSPEPSQLKSTPDVLIAKSDGIEESLKNGDKPYIGFFGNIQTYNTTNTLKINNNTKFDAVVVVYHQKTKQYIQHAYLQKGFLVEFDFLPKEGVFWKCVLGNHWNKNKILLNNKIVGGFDQTIQYQSWKTAPVFFNQSFEEIQILDVINEESFNKEHISSEIDFFKK